VSPLLLLAFCWGFAEATAFFIVPDVCLSFIALRSFGTSFIASLFSLTGAVLGGSLMYCLGRWAPGTARSFLERIPAISPALVDLVESNIVALGARAIVLGPLKGVPYKIYAVQWGKFRRSFLQFAFVSMPARYPRFLLSILAVAALRAFITQYVLCAIWLAFYIFYFWRFNSIGGKTHRGR
jgi:membrane protein YqaA with SNARE-associated domain